MLAAWSTAPSEPVFNRPLIRSGPAHHSFYSPMTVTQFNNERCRYRRLVVHLHFPFSVVFGKLLPFFGNMFPHLRSYTARERPKIAPAVRNARCEYSRDGTCRCQFPIGADVVRTRC